MSAQTSLPSPSAQRSELAQAFAAGRARLGLVAVLLALAAAAWVAAANQMAGMDAGPGTDLGALGWFVGVWVVMMAAMMFPSVSPTVALYARMTHKRGGGQALVFAGGYLLVWALAGILAYGLFEFGRAVLGSQLAWNAGGRWFAGGVIALAALYELTPLKSVCLTKCRSPLGFLVSRWRGGYRGALDMGLRHAGWCVGCCWALMASLFALGVMSLIWMALVAALIAIEKTFPWRRAVTWGTAALLLVLAVAVIAVPQALPGLTIPGGMHDMGPMPNGMGSMHN